MTHPIRRCLAAAVWTAALSYGSDLACGQDIVISPGGAVTGEAAAQPAAVTAEVRPAKASFAVGERISVVTRITNTSAKVVRVTNPDARTLSVRTKDGSATWIAWPKHPSHQQEVPIVLEGGVSRVATLLIEPGKTAEVTCMLDADAYAFVKYDREQHATKNADFRPEAGDIVVTANVLAASPGAGKTTWQECGSSPTAITIVDK